MCLTKQQQIRIAAELSITAAAAIADVSPHTWKVYELNPEAIKVRKKKAACDAALARMFDLAKQRAA